MFEVGKKYKLMEFTPTVYEAKTVYGDWAIFETSEKEITACRWSSSCWTELKPLLLKELKPGEKFQFVAWPYSDMFPSERNSIFIRGKDYRDHVSVMSTFSWNVWTDNIFLNKEVIRVT